MNILGKLYIHTHETTYKKSYAGACKAAVGRFAPVLENRGMYCTVLYIPVSLVSAHTCIFIAVPSVYTSVGSRSVGTQ